MSHWPYILAAYALTFGGGAAVTLHAWLRMRKAEADAEAIRRK